MRHQRFRHNPFLFASREEAVVYLELMGFTVEESHISCNGLAMATHRTLFAIDSLCDNGFSYAAPSLEDAARHQTSVGASSGIGKAIALALGHAGADVCVNYVSGADKAQEIVDHLGEHGFKAFAYQADVSKEEQVIAMFDAMREEFGTVDVVINNAGLQQDAPVDKMTLAQWQKVIDVNLTGQFLCSREAVREFKRRGVRPEISCAAGKIICVSSVHEVIPWAGHVNYAASKGGVMLMMKSIAQEVAPYRIRVNSIAPGAIRTPINMQAWDTPEHYAELLKLIPYKRIGEAEEIGRAAVWLASDDSDYVHGITLFVDGGMTLYPGFETGG